MATPKALAQAARHAGSGPCTLKGHLFVVGDDTSTCHFCRVVKQGRALPALQDCRFAVAADIGDDPVPCAVVNEHKWIFADIVGMQVVCLRCRRRLPGILGLTKTSTCAGERVGGATGPGPPALSSEMASMRR